MLRYVLPSLVFVLVGCSDPIERCDELVRWDPVARAWKSPCNQPRETPGAVTLRTLRERNPPYAIDAGVQIHGVVITAVDSYDEDNAGHVGSIWVEEISAPTGSDPVSPCPLLPDGSGRACAIQLFNPDLAPTGYQPAVGDLIDISGGAYQEFNCTPCGSDPLNPAIFPNGHFIPEIGYALASSIGVAPVPPAVRVSSVADLEAHLGAAANGQPQDQYIGVLVELHDVEATGLPDSRYHEIPVGRDPRNGLKVTQQMVPIAGEGDAGVMPGMRWPCIRGIATYFYGPKLIPRSLADLRCAN